MKKELISELFKKFEEACYDLDGLECWSGRELQNILGYSDWRNFTNIIQKASKSCKNSGEQVADHFVGVTKMVELGSCAKLCSGARGLQDAALKKINLVKGYI